MSQLLLKMVHNKRKEPMTAFEHLNALSALERPDGVIAFATDTVYGLGCQIDHPEAVARIYRIKGRDEQKPLILLGYEQQSFVPFVDDLPPVALDLMERHWPGALTIVLPKSGRVPETVSRGLETVALRVPDCASFRELLKLVPGGVLATTSANRSGDAPALTASEVYSHFGDDVDYVLTDDAAIRHGVASTVVRVEPEGTIRVLRQGSVVID